MRYRWSILVFGSLLTAAGCGGGGTSTPNQGQTGTQTVQLGPAQVSFTSKPSSQIGVAGQTVSIYGMAGTTFTDVIVDPPKTLSNTAILFTNVGRGGLWSYANGQVNTIGGVSLALATSADWTHDGHIISVINDPILSEQIYECNYDGSGLRRLTNSKHLVATSRVSWSPLNNLIAFDDGKANIYTISPTGTNETLRVSGGIMPAFSPNGQLLVFQDNFDSTISTIPANGGTITKIASNGANNLYEFPSFSPDGNFVIFTGYSTTLPPQPVIYSTSGLSTGLVIPTTDAGISGTFSPDGNEVAYILSSPAGSGVLSLVTATYSGSGLTTAVPPTTGLVPQTCSWSPFPGPQRFVAGSLGTVMPTASGFLFGQVGDRFGGFAAFTAKTPADATVTSEGTPSGTAPYTFDIHADQVTSLSYTNGLYSGVTTVSTGNYSDVLVSVSGISGQISFVAPILQKRTNGALAKPVVTHAGGNTVYSGSFAGLYDTKGKNLAPSGLSEYRLDPKGKLLGFK